MPLLTYPIFYCFAPLIFLAKEKTGNVRFGMIQLVKALLRTD